MQENKGRSRKRRPSGRAAACLKRAVVGLLCVAMVAEYVPGALTFAAEAATAVESAGSVDDETFTLDDVSSIAAEADSETGTDDGTYTEAGESHEPDHAADEMTGPEADEEIAGQDEDTDLQSDDEENAGSGADEDEAGGNAEIREDSEALDDTGYEDEDDADTGAEDKGSEDDCDAAIVDGDAVIVDADTGTAVPATIPAPSQTSYKNISAKIYADDTYEEILSDGATIELSGRMPKGAVAKAYPVEVEIEDITVLAAYEITIFDEDGEEYEPDDGDVIEVIIENDEIREALEEEAELTVFHMEDEDDEPEEIVRLSRKSKKAKFSARHFSIYIVGTDDELYELDGETRHYVYTLNFYLGDVKNPGYGDAKDQYVLLSTQTVSPGEKVEMSSVPDVENYEFVGWYSEPYGEGEKYDFYNGVMPDIEKDTSDDTGENSSGDAVIDLYAHYVELYTVHFMAHAHEDGGDDTDVIFHTEHYSPGQTLDTAAAEDLYLAEGYLSYVDGETGALITALAVTGWLDADGSKWKTGDTIDWSVTDGALELYPVVEPAYWVYYDMNGHDSVENPAPEYVLASEDTIGVLPEPAVSGYSFEGWYTETEGGDEVAKDTKLEDLPKNTDSSITLYAHWTENYVAYTINIWCQKAIDGKAGVDSKEIRPGETYDDYIQYYDYAESHYVTAEQSKLKTSETPTTSKVYNWSTYTGYATMTDSNSAYYGFEYREEHTTGSGWSQQTVPETTSVTRTLNDLAAKTMAADGSTVINIFYNRVTVTWTFQASGQGINRYGVDGTLIGLYGTSVYQGDDNAAGSLSDWPDPGDGRIWKTNNTNITFKAIFDLENNQSSATFSNAGYSREHYLYYYLEVTNEDTQVDENGAKAREAFEYGVDYTRTVNETPYVYTRRGTTSSGNFNFTDKFAGYYVVGYIDAWDGATRTAYTEASGSTVIGSGSGGGGTGTAVTSHTFSNNGYIFNNANDKLTLTLISDDKVVGVDAAGDAVETAEEYTYKPKYGENLNNYPFPETMDGETWGPAYYYHFEGWYADPTFTAAFETEIMPNYNLAAYADWELNDITVTFITGTSSSEGPDAQILTATQKAADPGTLEREGYTHVGWVDQNGKVFNFDTVLYADTTLTAIWKADDESGYTMKYDINVDNSYGLLDGYEDGTTSEDPEHFTVDEELWTIERAFPDLTKDVTDMFIGWNTAADGTGTMYYPDDIFALEDVEVSNEGAVTLYAIWAHRNESTLVLIHNYPEGYILHDGEAAQDILTGDNLTPINLYTVSGLGYHHEIEVSDSDGAVHLYRFDGWSATDPGDDPTDKDVDIEADETVAVDTLKTSTGTNANYLYAVWLEVHDITVTKEVVNNAVNYTVPEDQTFTFRWSFVDGEGNTNTNESDIEISDGESFTIPGVASGESVTITEVETEGFTASYNGAHADAEDDGKGTCSFTMTGNSTKITACNTVDTIKLKVEKVWSDSDEADHSGDEVTVTVTNDERKVKEITLNSDNSWHGYIEVKSGEDISGYSVAENEITGYVSSVESSKDDETGDITFTITNSPEPFSGDDDDPEGTKPDGGEPETEPGPDTQPGVTPEPDDFVPVKNVDKGEGITVNYGDRLTYTITYKNTTDAPAAIVITDMLDSGLTFVSATDDGEYILADRTVTWVLQNVEPGYEGSVSLTVSVNSIGRSNGSVSNTAFVKAGDGEAAEVSSAVINPVAKNTSSGSSYGSSGSSGSSGGNVRNVHSGKTGHWILEGGYLTLPDGSHPSNEYLDVDGQVWAFYTYGYAVARRHMQYYTDEAILAAGYIPRVTGTWETIGWWFEYDDGTYPHDEWAYLEYNGRTNWYHFDVDGWMDDGWFTENGITYYLHTVYDGTRGHMYTG